MTLLQRLKSSLGAVGPRATLVKLWSMWLDWWFDFRYGLDTCTASELSELTIASDNKSKGKLYQPVRLLALRKFFRVIRPRVPADATLVDIGSGKGRVLIAGAEAGFREARGLEFAHELCVIARENCARYRQRSGSKTEFETIEGDAAAYAFRPHENFFMLCNPFDASVLTVVLDNLMNSLRAKPREAWLAYYNPQWESLFERYPSFKLVDSFNLWGHHIRFYHHRP